MGGGIHAQSKWRQFKSDGWEHLACPGSLGADAGAVLAICPEIFHFSETEKEACRSPETNFRSGWRAPQQNGRPAEVWQVSHQDPPHTWPSHMVAEREAVLQFLDAAIRFATPQLNDLIQDFGGHRSELNARRCQYTSSVRLLYYPGGEEEGFSEHTDFGLISLFVAESGPGLELRTAQGEWQMALIEARSKWVIAAGEMLNARTGGSIPAAPHRVGLVRTERFAVTVFVHPHPEYVLRFDGSEETTAGVFFDRLMSKMMRNVRGRS